MRACARTPHAHWRTGGFGILYVLHVVNEVSAWREQFCNFRFDGIARRARARTRSRTRARPREVMCGRSDGLNISFRLGRMRVWSYLPVISRSTRTQAVELAWNVLICAIIKSCIARSHTAAAAAAAAVAFNPIQAARIPNSTYLWRSSPAPEKVCRLYLLADFIW